jgi:hypothetical protein
MNASGSAPQNICSALRHQGKLFSETQAHAKLNLAGRKN